MTVRELNERWRANRIVGGWLVIAAVGISVYVARPVGPIGEATYLAVSFGAALAAWLFASRQRGVPRRFGRLVAAGVGLSASGDLVYQVFGWFGREPSVSVADVGWLGSYGALIGGLVLLLTAHPLGGRFRLDALLDATSVFVVAFLICWELSVRATVTDGTLPIVVRVTWAAYPILDSVLLAAIIHAVVGGGLRSRTGAVLAAGAGCWLLADFAFLIAGPTESFGSWLEVGWLAGAALLAASAGTTDRRSRPSPGAGGQPALAGEERAYRRAGRRIALVFLPLMVPPTIEVVGFLRGEDPNPLPLFVATASLVLVAFARAARILRSERRARAQLRASKRFFSALAAGAADTVMVIDGELRVTYQSDRPGAQDAGRSAAAAHFLDVLAPVDEVLVSVTLQRCLGAAGEVVEAEVEVADEQATRWLAARFTNLLDDPDVNGIVVNLHDITDRKGAERALVRQAFHDALTGLPNRALFADRVEHALQRSARTGQDPVVLYVDLDGFKPVNDSLGHEAGDELLQVVAQRLKLVMRSEDTVARLGGDEFAVLIEQAAAPSKDGPATAERLLAELHEPVTIRGRQLRISASVGVTLADAMSTASSLLREADVAMYVAKSSGPGHWALYQHEMGAAALERIQLTSDLEDALARDEFRLVYQPVVELSDQRITGFEALLRWQHPTLGLLTPDRFIGLAEATGHIVAIGRWVLVEACQAVARWRRELARDDLSIAVNVSGHQLASAELPDDVADALRRSRLDPSSLVLELTESVLVDDPTAAAQRLEALRRLGVRVAIDDFGTGFSSLSYLHRLPVDILKIDRSFVGSISEEGTMPAVVSAIIDLAHSLQLETIAEGIERSTQRNRLMDRRCSHGQGYLFAKPLSPVDAEQLLMTATGTGVAPADRAGSSDEHAAATARGRPVIAGAAVAGGGPAAER